MHKKIILIIFLFIGNSVQAMQKEHIPLWQKTLFGSASVGLVCVGTYSLYKNGLNSNNSAFLPALSSIVGGLVTSIAGTMMLNYIQKVNQNKRTIDSLNQKNTELNISLTAANKRAGSLDKDLDMLREQNKELLSISSTLCAGESNRGRGRGAKRNGTDRFELLYKALLVDFHAVSRQFSKVMKNNQAIPTIALLSNHISQSDIDDMGLQDYLEVPPLNTNGNIDAKE